MNPGKDYAAMVREQNKAVRILPLHMAWEFMPRAIRKTVQYPSEALAALAQQNRWQLPVQARQWLGQPDWALVVTDPEQIIQYVNESFERMTGYAAEEAIGRHPSFLQGDSTDPLARLRIRTALETEQSIRETIHNYRKDNSVYSCDVTIFSVHNDLHQLVNFIAFEQETFV
ncbi:PAS domain-containing protein [Spirosoma koreense]